MKAILVVDMPTSCSICPCSREGNSPSDKWKCQAVIEDSHFKWIDKSESIPEWCPLKPMPDREKANDGSNAEFKMIDGAWTSGFNACLDEILGETE